MIKKKDVLEEHPNNLLFYVLELPLIIFFVPILLFSFILDDIFGEVISNLIIVMLITFIIAAVVYGLIA